LTHWALIGLLPMSDPSWREPPRQVWYELDEALALLADLEEASASYTRALIPSRSTIRGGRIRRLSKLRSCGSHGTAGA
jgi:hypothetical protein